MKLVTLSIAIATSQICTFVPQAISQENKAQPDRLHLMGPILKAAETASS
jgi:hypothetical protein